MKKIIVFAAAVCLVACSFLLIVQPASAAIATASGSVSGTGPVAWVQADEVNSFLSVQWGSSGFVSPIEVGVYDINGVTSIKDNHFALLSAVTPMAISNTFKVESNLLSLMQPINNIASNAGATTFSLSSDEFGFYLYNGLGTDNNENYLTTYNYDGNNNTFTLNWGSAVVTIHATDVSPVPIPTAVFLLGSGLVGLAGFKRRNR